MRFFFRLILVPTGILASINLLGSSCLRDIYEHNGLEAAIEAVNSSDFEPSHNSLLETVGIPPLLRSQLLKMKRNTVLPCLEDLVNGIISEATSLVDTSGLISLLVELVEDEDLVVNMAFSRAINLAALSVAFDLTQRYTDIKISDLQNSQRDLFQAFQILPVPDIYAAIDEMELMDDEGLVIQILVMTLHLKVPAEYFVKIYKRHCPSRMHQKWRLTLLQAIIELSHPSELVPLVLGGIMEEDRLWVCYIPEHEIIGKVISYGRPDIMLHLINHELLNYDLEKVYHLMYQSLKNCVANLRHENTVERRISRWIRGLIMHGSYKIPMLALINVTDSVGEAIFDFAAAILIDTGAFVDLAISYFENFEVTLHTKL